MMVHYNEIPWGFSVQTQTQTLIDNLVEICITGSLCTKSTNPMLISLTQFSVKIYVDEQQFPNMASDSLAAVLQSEAILEDDHPLP